MHYGRSIHLPVVSVDDYTAIVHHHPLRLRHRVRGVVALLVEAHQNVVMNSAPLFFIIKAPIMLRWQV